MMLPQRTRTCGGSDQHLVPRPERWQQLQEWPVKVTSDPNLLFSQCGRSGIGAPPCRCLVGSMIRWSSCIWRTRAVECRRWSVVGSSCCLRCRDWRYSICETCSWTEVVGQHRLRSMLNLVVQTCPLVPALPRSWIVCYRLRLNVVAVVRIVWHGSLQGDVKARLARLSDEEDGANPCLQSAPERLLNTSGFSVMALDYYALRQPLGRALIVWTNGAAPHS